MFSDSALYENILTTSISLSPPQTHKEGFNLSKHRNVQVHDKSTNLHGPHSYPKSSHRHCGIERVISLSTLTHFQSHHEPQTNVHICIYVLKTTSDLSRLLLIHI